MASPDRQELLLTFYNLLKSFSVVVSINEEVRDELLIVSIALFCTRHGDPGWDVLFVPKDISHERRLARSTLSYKDANLVIRHPGRIELPELKRHI